MSSEWKRDLVADVKETIEAIEALCIKDDPAEAARLGRRLQYHGTQVALAAEQASGGPL